jgi:hypothetical protein
MSCDCMVSMYAPPTNKGKVVTLSTCGRFLMEKSKVRTSLFFKHLGLFITCGRMSRKGYTRKQFHINVVNRDMYRNNTRVYVTVRTPLNQGVTITKK